MNCLDCRRLLLTQPQARTAELASHLQACPACARWAAEQARFEQRLGAALRLPVAENLQNRVRLEASLRPRRPRRWRLRVAAVVAAISVFLGLGLSGWEYQTSRNLTNAMAVQMQASLPSRTPRAEPITNPELARLATRLGRYLQSSQRIRVVSMRQSVIGGRPAAYLRVVHGNGHASIFVLPHAWLALEHNVDADGTPGRLIPTSAGVIAVFCPDRRMLARVTRDLRSEPRWQG